MSKAAAIVVLALAAAAGCGSDGNGDEPLGPEASARVVRVIDGDTIEVSIEGSEEDVRYIGVDTPETVKPGAPVECYGPQASAANHRLVEGRIVRLVFDRERRDAYGRLLAYVYTRGPKDAGKPRGDARTPRGEAGESRFVNAALVRGGYARTLEIAPNTSHAPELRRLEARAGRAGRGLWGGC